MAKVGTGRGADLKEFKLIHVRFRKPLNPVPGTGHTINSGFYFSSF